MNENSWTSYHYHDSKGKILGSIMFVDSFKYKALTNGIFIGWYISEECAKSAVEEAFFDGVKCERS